MAVSPVIREAVGDKDIGKQQQTRSLNLSRAVFDSPEDVRDSLDLTVEQKIELLKNWVYDDAALGVALEEGMPETDVDDITRRVLMVLEELTGGIDLEHTGPNKHHGIPSGSRKS
jgi:hypothetical protein